MAKLRLSDFEKDERKKATRSSALLQGKMTFGDSAYEGDETLRLARELDYTSVVPPNPNRLNPWDYDYMAYRLRFPGHRR
ncbi:MAG: hypothetical protein ACREFE_03070 [Limisphaerales bacterium]